MEGAFLTPLRQYTRLCWAHYQACRAKVKPYSFSAHLYNRGYEVDEYDRGYLDQLVASCHRDAQHHQEAPEEDDHLPVPKFTLVAQVERALRGWGRRGSAASPSSRHGEEFGSLSNKEHVGLATDKHGMLESRRFPK